MSKINDKVVDVIKELTGVEGIQVTDSLLEVGIDSLKTVELIVHLEDAFNIQFNDADLDASNLKHVDKVISLVERYTSDCEETV